MQEGGSATKVSNPLSNSRLSFSSHLMTLHLLLLMQFLAAHICYAVATCLPGFADDLGPSPSPSGGDSEAKGGSQHDAQRAQHGPAISLRYCLLGADHAMHPRTFSSASPWAVQRMEVLEWVLRAAAATGPGGGGGGGGAGGGGGGGGGGGAGGGAMILPLQPYKLLYAHTLTEYGHVPEALLYCQVGWRLEVGGWLLCCGAIILSSTTRSQRFSLHTSASGPGSNVTVHPRSPASTQLLSPCQGAGGAQGPADSFRCGTLV